MDRIDHKEVWNTVINSSKIWPPEHPFHHLDMLLYLGLAILVGLTMILFHEWKLRREARRSPSANALWVADWPNTSDKDQNHV
jgi:hypothetical protein